MVTAPAPEARAAATKSRLRTPDVTLSAKRAIGRMKTLLGQVQSVVVPGPLEYDDNLDGDPGSDPSR